MNILCYGDSNTWGLNPAGGRWPRDVRWTGRLAQLLGDGCYVIEDGLCGRTTVFNDVFVEGRDGSAQLAVTLDKHDPLDLVILALGINDCALTFGATPAISARGIDKLIRIVKGMTYRDGGVPKILVMCPPPTAPNIEDGPFPGYNKESYVKSTQLAPYYKAIADQYGCLFFDAGTVAKASDCDKLHMEKESHEAIAQALAKIIQNV